jgi:hypothetical protein
MRRAISTDFTIDKRLLALSPEARAIKLVDKGNNTATKLRETPFTSAKVKAEITFADKDTFAFYDYNGMLYYVLAGMTEAGLIPKDTKYEMSIHHKNGSKTEAKVHLSIIGETNVHHR